MVNSTKSFRVRLILNLNYSTILVLFHFFLGIVELPEDQFLDVFVCNITGTYDIYLRLVGEEYSVRPNIRSSENDIVTVDELVEILTRVDKLSESNLINPNQLLFSFNENVSVRTNTACVIYCL